MKVIKIGTTKNQSRGFRAFIPHALPLATRLTKKMFEQIKTAVFENTPFEQLIGYLKLSGKVGGKNHVENQIKQVKAANTLTKMGKELVGYNKRSVCTKTEIQSIQ